MSRHFPMSLARVPVALIAILFALGSATTATTANAATPLDPAPWTLDPVCFLPRHLPRELAPGNPAASTLQMIERLNKIHRESDPATMAYMNDQLVDHIQRALDRTTKPSTQVQIRFHLAYQQTLAGRPDHALNTLLAIDRLASDGQVSITPEGRNAFRMQTAVAFLRLGEQENCIGQHTAESCLFPLPESARHSLPRGSEGAIRILGAHLKENPDDLSARWLLNLAHMTLGGYPSQVPLPWRIPPAVFASEYPMPEFPNIAETLGVDVHDLAGGVIVDDFDNDGFLDIFASSWALDEQIRFFRNNGDGTFTERTSEAGLVGLGGSLHIVQTDYNNDGFLDVWMPRGGWLGKAGRIPASLLRNNGDGTFTDVTVASGLLRARPTQTCAWFDFDLDGHLDLFIGNETVDPADPDPCELFRNNGDGTFTECAKDVGIDIAAFVKGVACADYDNDGYLDLYLSVRNGPNILLRNAGPDPSAQPGRVAWKFTDTTQQAGVAEPFHSFPAWFFDFDNDGHEDLFCSGYGINDVGDIAADYLKMPSRGARPRLYRNRGDGTFEDVTAPMGLNRVCHTMGCNFGDLDNDGWLDFYLATGDPEFATLVPNRMFRNRAGKRFDDVTTATGTGHLQKGHGVSFADLDNDGHQDVYVCMGGAYSGDRARNVLFHNPANTNGWIRLKLVGTKANRVAIGARIRLDLDGPGGTRTLHRTVGSGASFGANPLRQEIGLGDARSVARIEVRWPGDSTPQVWENLMPRHSYELTQGDPKAVPQAVNAIQFPSAPPATARIDSSVVVPE